MSKQTNNLVSKTQSKTSKSTKARGAVKAAASAAAFEMLEDRRLFSALTINGTGLDDVININQTGPVIRVNLNGAVQNFLAIRYTDITVNAFGGNDRVTATAMTSKPVTFNGGTGNDYLAGGRASDTFNGGDGNDMMLGGRGADEFNGGLGTDTADYSACYTALNISLDDVANDGMTFENDNVRSDVENVNGGYGKDTITGSSADNYLQGGGNTDTLRGMDGNDILDGGIGGWFPVNKNTGNDVLYGGNGDDTLHASDFGDNSLSGEAGNDWLYGYGGDDSLDGGAGSDHLFGGAGTDTVDGASGNDFVYGGTGDDVVYGGSGDDYCDGEAGNDKVYGNYGPQRNIFVIDPPIITLGAAAASLPVDTVVNPLPSPIDTTTIINPLPIDVVPIIRPVPYVPEIDLTPRFPQVDPRLIDPSIIVRPIFTESDNDIVHGGAGEDRVRGDGGNDQVFGDAGNDFCYGDAGNDIVHGGDDDDNVYGGAGDDQLFGDAGDDVLVSIGGGVNDQNTGGDGFDSVWCDAEASEIDNNDFWGALFEGLGGTHHRVGGFEQLRTSNVDTNATIATQTPSRELNGQNLLDPIAKGGTYQNFSDRPLFGHLGPHKDDIDQNGLADCYFLAGLSAVAKQNPNRIKQSVVDLGDGTYAVQFFDGGTAEFWRVDGQLPANGAGNPWGAGLGHDDALWGALMEKAWAFARSNRGTYAATEWGGIDTFVALNLANSGIGRANAIDALVNIKARLDDHQAVITWTPGSPPSDCPCVGSHMYSVERVDLQTFNFLGTEIVIGGTITVRNPWKTDGAGNDGVNDGYVTMSADQYFRGFSGAWSAVA